MKKIYLIRHAKSSWENKFIDDIDRPLNQRGIKACQIMAQHIYESGVNLPNVYCSPAARARTTIELISKHVPELSIQWQIDNELYSFDSSVLYMWCCSLDESISEVVIVGHNPALTNLCNMLSNSNIENIPTCGFVSLTSKCKIDWQNITKNSFDLSQFMSPKKLRKNGTNR